MSQACQGVSEDFGEQFVLHFLGEDLGHVGIDEAGRDGR